MSDVKEEMLIYHEETFGPVAPVIPFETEEEVVAMANDTRYGLASYVYTRDISRGMRVFETLRFGIVGINDINPTAAAAPFGGMKESGLGPEGGREGIAEYLETKLGGFSVQKIRGSMSLIAACSPFYYSLPQPLEEHAGSV